MNRTRISMILVSICFAALTQSVWGQTGAQSPRFGSRPTAGANMPKPNVVVDDLDLALPALTTFTGTFKIAITINIKSTNLGTDTIVCEAAAVVEDIGTTGLSGLYSEEASLVATRGTTTHCTVIIPYSWALANGSTDTVNLSWVIQAVNTTTNGQPTRVHSHTPAAIKVPANGTTTTITVTETI